VILQVLSHALPLTYGADVLHASITGTGRMPLWLDFLMLALFCAGLFAFSLRNVRTKWIL
jgi:ABC-2 type transport system permease protein